MIVKQTLSIYSQTRSYLFPQLSIYLEMKTPVKYCGKCGMNFMVMELLICYNHSDSCALDHYYSPEAIFKGYFKNRL